MRNDLRIKSMVYSLWSDSKGMSFCFSYLLKVSSRLIADENNKFYQKLTSRVEQSDILTKNEIPG